jgi:divalent metal cation (Fe/Co/Zn/Cd) transporter
VLIAGGGLFLSHLRGDNVPDAIASLLIGVLLAVAAFGLARPLADFLIGRSLADAQLQQLHQLFEETPEIGKVLSLRALYTGPEEVVVIAKIRPAPDVTTDALATAIDELVCRTRVALPLVADVFVHLTKEEGTATAR